MFAKGNTYFRCPRLNLRKRKKERERLIYIQYKLIKLSNIIVFLKKLRARFQITIHIIV